MVRNLCVVLALATPGSALAQQRDSYGRRIYPPAQPKAVEPPRERTPDVVKTYDDGTKTTTKTDSYDRPTTFRDYPNGTSEIDSGPNHRRTVLWPDGATDQLSTDRTMTVRYPDGSKAIYNFEPNTSGDRIIGITVRGPEAQGSPILQQMQRDAMPMLGDPAWATKARDAARFDWNTRDSDGKPGATNQLDAYFNPKTNAITLSTPLDTTRIYPDGTRQVDDSLQGTTRTFDPNGRITRIATIQGSGTSRSADVGYDDQGNLKTIAIPGVGNVERQPNGTWKLPDGKTITADVSLGKGIITAIGPTLPDGSRRVDQFRLDNVDNAKAWQSFTQTKEQADFVDGVAKKLGAPPGAAGAATAMELLEGTQRAFDERDRKFTDGLNTAAYRLSGERSDPKQYPAPLQRVRDLAAESRNLVVERQKLADNKDYQGLAGSDLTKRINEKEEAARDALVGFVPSAGDVARRIVDDLPAKIGGGINYAIDNPFKSLGVFAAGVAASIVAPEVMLVVAVGSLGLTGARAGNEIVRGYINRDVAQIWRGTDKAGDLVVEGGALVATAAAFKGLGALAKPLVAKVRPMVRRDTFPAAKAEFPVTENPLAPKGPKAEAPRDPLAPESRAYQPSDVPNSDFWLRQQSAGTTPKAENGWTRFAADAANDFPRYAKRAKELVGEGKAQSEDEGMLLALAEDYAKTLRSGERGSFGKLLNQRLLHPLSEPNAKGPGGITDPVAAAEARIQQFAAEVDPKLGTQGWYRNEHIAADGTVIPGTTTFRMDLAKNMFDLVMSKKIPAGMSPDEAMVVLAANRAWGNSADPTRLIASTSGDRALMKDVFFRINRAKSPERTQAERTEDFADAMHAYFNATPFERGSDAVGRVFFMAKFRETFGGAMKMPDLVDVKAMTMSPKEFQAFIKPSLTPPPTAGKSLSAAPPVTPGGKLPTLAPFFGGGNRDDARPAPCDATTPPPPP